MVQRLSQMASVPTDQRRRHVKFSLMLCAERWDSSGARLLGRPAVEAGRVDGVEVEGRLARDRMHRHRRMELLGERLGRRGDGHGCQILDLVEQAAGAVGHAGRVDGLQAAAASP